MFLKVLLSLCMTSGFFLLPFTTPTAQAQVVLGYKTGLKKARQENKWVLVQFESDLCKYCAQMTREFRESPAVSALLKEHFVWVKIHRTEDAALTQKFGVWNYPWMMILKSDGSKLADMPGYQSPETMADLLRFFITESYTTMDLETFRKR